jgi:hypothetical protein
MVEPRKSAQRGRPVYAPTRGSQLVGESVNAQGNERALEHREQGRVFKARTGADRPAGTSTARMSTGVNPQESITGTFLHRA